MCATYLSAAGRKIIAGDFDPVLSEDDDLVHTNDFMDVWAHLYPNAPGHTWGVHGEQSFSPNRLDKVALLNLVPFCMGVLQTSRFGFCDEDTSVDVIQRCSTVHFSGHFGVKCDVECAEDLSDLVDRPK
jgi:tyrosyl-DNA phosphodiesterase 2